MSRNGNTTKDVLLGMPHGTASGKLRKIIIFRLAEKCGELICFHCTKQIESIDDLSIEHKEAWQGAADPKLAFFNPDNIAFSHLSCNISAGSRTKTAAINTSKTHCPSGHEYTDTNTYRNNVNGSRHCRTCRREYMQKHRKH